MPRAAYKLLPVALLALLSGAQAATRSSPLNRDTTIRRDDDGSWMELSGQSARRDRARQQVRDGQPDEQAEGRTDEPASQESAEVSETPAASKRTPRTGGMFDSDDLGAIVNFTGNGVETVRTEQIVADDGQVIEVTTIRGFTPSTDIVPMSGDDVVGWGITVVDADLFKADGKKFTTLPGGRLIEYVGTVKSSKGAMAKCRIWRGDVWSGECLISTAAFMNFLGGREQVAADDLSAQLRYYALNARLERRKQELEIKARTGNNPHAAELSAIGKEYNDLIEEITDLTKRRDAATGAERTRLAGELQKRIVRQTEVENRLKPVKAKYEDWKKAHAGESKAEFDWRHDPECAKLQEEMTALAPSNSPEGGTGK